MKAIGIDIGTTTICGVLLDAGSGALEKKITCPNEAGKEGKLPFERLQDPAKIEETCRKILTELQEEELQKDELQIKSLGVTGQMHGILYLDREGNPVSPLMTWQDERGNQPCKGQGSYAEHLSELTGYRLACGYGAVTHYYNTKNDQIPKEAVVFCTIPDYIAMKLAGKKKPLLHSSMAASLGLFSLETGSFDQAQIEKAGMDLHFFPEIGREKEGMGVYQKNTLVSLAFGDNQASFLGSVDNRSRVLLNVGTGSQVSVLGNEIKRFPSLECRPYIEQKYLYVGSSLCGGYAYALLKGFWEEILALCGAEKEKASYEAMNLSGQMAKREGTHLRVDTRFHGTRENSRLTGGIAGITSENFRPGALALGVLEGISRELLEFYGELEASDDSPCVTGSGNGIRKNPLLREILKEQFGKELRIPPYAEEAAYGSGLFSLYAAGVYRNLEEIAALNSVSAGRDQ